LCQRVIAFCEKNIGLEIPSTDKFNNDDLSILNNFSSNIDNIVDKIDNQNINYYIDFVVGQLFNANKYFNDQAPWTKKSDTKRLNTIVYVSLELIRKISILLYPVMPQTTLKVLSIFSINEKQINFLSITDNKFLKEKMKISKLDILFKKINKND